MGKLIRIWESTLTGEVSDRRVDDSYVSTNLVFDTNMRIVYYKFSEIVSVYSKNIPDQENSDTKVGYMCPYISHKGKYCRFTGYSIEEI